MSRVIGALVGRCPRALSSEAPALASGPLSFFQILLGTEALASQSDQAPGSYLAGNASSWLCWQSRGPLLLGFGRKPGS